MGVQIRSSLKLLAACLILTCATSASPGWSDQIQVIHTGSDAKALVQVQERDGTLYASLTGLARAFGAGAFWAPLTQKAVLKLGDGRLTATAFSRTVVVNEKPANLPWPVTVLEGDLYVPLGPFVPLLDDIVAGQLTWEPSGKRLIVKTSDNSILGMSIEDRANGTLVILRTTQRFEHIEDTTTEPKWLNISVYQGKLDPVALADTRPSGAVRNVKAFQYENSAQVSLQIDKTISSYRISQKDDPHEILVLLKKGGTSPEQNAKDLAFDKELWTIHTIVLDPGHGGKDPGAVGPTGLMEKDVVLDVGLRLAKLFEEQLRVKVVLTRDTDEFVGLKERGRIANRSDGKLFVSLHCNGHPKASTRGTQVFFLSEAKTEEAIRVAQLENSVLKFEFSSDLDRSVSEEDFSMVDMLNMITLEMRSTTFLKESQDLADIIDRHLVERLDLHDLGVRQAGFYVMKGTLPTMPSVLVEIAFITNPYEEALLKQRAFRKKAAQAIFYGVKAFVDKYQRELALPSP